MFDKQRAFKQLGMIDKQRALSIPTSVLGVFLFFGAVHPLHAQASQPAADDPYLARARRILRQTPLIDGHNDLPWRIREDSVARGNADAYDLRRRTPGHTDLDRLKKGMVGAQFWSVYTPGEYRDSGYARVQLEQIAIARRVIAKYRSPSALPTSVAISNREKSPRSSASRAVMPSRTRLARCARTTVLAPAT